MPAARDLKLMLLACVSFLGLAAAVWLGVADSDLLLAAPFFVLVVPLLAGRYWGEDALQRLAAGRMATRRRRAPGALGVPALCRPAVTAVRDRLVAGAHGCLPPPLVARA